MSKRYTEGIIGRNAVILDNGVPMTISEALAALNSLEGEEYEEIVYDELTETIFTQISLTEDNIDAINWIIKPNN